MRVIVLKNKYNNSSNFSKKDRNFEDEDDYEDERIAEGESKNTNDIFINIFSNEYFVDSSKL